MNLDDMKIRRDAILQALYQGVLTVRAGDKSVTYKSNNEMKEAISILDAAIGQLEGRSRVKRVLTYGRNGL